MKSRDAVFSLEREYRYVLWRVWDEERPMVNIIGLNPSTANEITDDPTMRRCTSFAESMGYGGYYMTNLFAFRTAYPTELFKANDPVGIDNDKWIVEISSRVDKVVLAWGVNGVFRNRDNDVYELVKSKSFCLGLTKNGFPRHPLYLRADTRIQKFAK